MKIELFENVRGEWMFHIKSRNGKIIAVGESYEKKAGALRTARLFRLQIIELKTNR